MPKLPSIKINKLLSAILKLGFLEHHRSGSHLQLKHPDGRRVTIPMHAGKDIKKGTLGGILRDIRLSKDEFVKLLKN